MYPKTRGVRNYFIKLGVILFVLLVPFFISLLFPSLFAEYVILSEEKAELYAKNLREQIDSFNDKTEYVLILKDNKNYYTICKDERGDLLAQVKLPSGLMHYEQGVLYYHDENNNQKVKYSLNIDFPYSYIDNLVLELNERVNKSVKEQLPKISKYWGSYVVMEYDPEHLADIFSNIEMKNVSLAFKFSEDYFIYYLGGEEYSNFDTIYLEGSYNQESLYRIRSLPNKSEYIETESNQIPIEIKLLENLK